MLRLRWGFLKYFSNVGQHFHSAARVQGSENVVALNQFVFNYMGGSLSNNLRTNQIIRDLPSSRMITPIEIPRSTLINEITEIIRNEEIYTPASENCVVEKQAARLIVIRRRKMKKHKLKKLRKKMKFEWAKVRQRREMRKEKAFQAQLISQIKLAEQFSAEHYVISKLQQSKEVRIPRFWKGRRLPQFIIKQKLGMS